MGGGFGVTAAGLAAAAADRRLRRRWWRRPRRIGGGFGQEAAAAAVSWRGSAAVEVEAEAIAKAEPPEGHVLNKGDMEVLGHCHFDPPATV